MLNPNAANSDKSFAGDNFVRFTGDVQKMQEMELHYLKVKAGGHLQAEPTRAELLYRALKVREDEKGAERKKKILEKYGSNEAYNTGDTSGAVENVYREYDNDGQVIADANDSVASKYEEDVLERGHTKIWGSFWENGNWGYACCGSTERYSECKKLG